MNPLVVQQGNSPIILGQPHGGTYVPADILVRLNDRGRELTDTDWHIHRLYDVGIKVPDKDLSECTIKRNEFHGDWNYEIYPRKPA